MERGTLDCFRVDFRATRPSVNLAARVRPGQSGAVGLWDRARALLGIDKAERKVLEGTAASELRSRKKGRPPLPEVSAGPGATLEDVLAVRETGRLEEARVLLSSIDKGHGLRTVLRAAAALEAGDERELGQLFPALQAREPSWQLSLQLAFALDDEERRQALAREAERLGAPAWAIAWLTALSNDPDVRRRGLVDLLFEDAALARTVAARDLAVERVVADNEAIGRYAAFAHGRDLVRRFGAARVADLLDRLRGRAL
jgi:hypothetical protein